MATTPNRELRERFAAAGQDGVFRFWGDLTDTERALLEADLRGIDLALVRTLTEKVDGAAAKLPELGEIEPVRRDAPDGAEAVEAGRELLAHGHVAFFTVAGGQGTRLGFPGPKGCYPIGPSSGKTLFRWHAETALAAARRYGRAIPWLVMVSEANAEETRVHFEQNAWYGLEGRVRFVRQRMLPALDAEGKILLAERHRVALAPNGHGGSLEAAGRGDEQVWLREHGATVLSYFQVDNPLLNPADAAFLGQHVLRDAEMTVKVVRKSHPFERAGVVTLVNGRPGVVEYTELPEDLARQRDEKGALRYGLANIAAHTLSLDFVERYAGEGLPYHCAVKKVACVDEGGAATEVMGRKFETFIFDAIPAARNFFAFLTEREEEFSPLKNEEGENSPSTVAASLLARTRAWYARAGATAPERDEELEMSPLAAYDYETFQDYLRARGGP